MTLFSEEIIDATGDVGQYTSIGSISGKLNIAYYDVSNKGLKLATLDDTDWIIQDVDSLEEDPDQILSPVSTTSIAKILDSTDGRLFIPSIVDVFVYKKILSGNWVQIRKIETGISVSNSKIVDISSDEDTLSLLVLNDGDLEIRIHRRDYFDGGTFAGSDSDTWGLVQTISLTGNNLSISISGDTIITSGSPNVGRFEYYLRGVAEFSHVQTFVATSSVSTSYGRSISLDESSGTLVVSDIGDSSFAGKIYIYNLNSDGLWEDVKSITASDAQSEDRLGGSIYTDGTIIAAVGQRVSGAAFIGKVTIFEKDQGGANNWGQVFNDNNSNNNAYSSVVSDGSIVFAGSYISGSVVVYNSSSSINWALATTIEDSNDFGFSLAYSEDVLFVGDPNAQDVSIFSNLSFGDHGKFANLIQYNDNPIITYYDATQQSLKIAIYNGSIWTKSYIDTVGNVGEYCSVDIVGDTIGVSYYDTTNGNLKYATADLSQSDLFWQIFSIDSTGDVGKYASLIFIGEVPHIVYYDATNAKLKYAVLSSGSWVISDIDTGSVGQYVSISSLDDQPVVAYYDDSNDDLLFGSYDGSTWSIETVDSIGNVGQFTDIEMIDGQPCIVYYDATNGDLKRAYRRNDGAWVIVILTGFTSSDPDKGKYASVYVKNGDIHVAFYDATDNNLMYGTETVLASDTDLNLTVNSSVVVSGLNAVDTHITERNVNFEIDGIVIITGFLGAKFQGDEYESIHGGKWYYAQNRPGTPWFDIVNNNIGWTVQFNLDVIRVQNSDSLSDIDPPDGLGIYFNDGSYQETIYFFEQEIAFRYLNQSVRYDTTEATDYRLTVQGRRARLYARREDDLTFSLISDVSLDKLATNEGNGRSPSAVEDSDNVLHVVWHDDGNSLGQLYYSSLSNEWSDPDPLLLSNYGVRNPKIDIDSDNNLYVVFESNESDETSIGFMYKTEIGWTEHELIGPGLGLSRAPSISIDSSGNVHVAWEDHRFGHPEILYTYRDKSTLEWASIVRVTNTPFGATKPSVDTHRERCYITWTRRNTDETQKIQGKYFNALSQVWSDERDISDSSAQSADDSFILLDSSGRSYVSWHDDHSGVYEIYTRILNPDFNPISDVETVTNASGGDSKYPQMSIHSTTGYIWFVWNDERSDYPSTYVARYDPINGSWVSSGQGSHDIKIEPLDQRSSYNPAVPKNFTGNLNIIYESEFASESDEYLPTKLTFSQIREANYDLTTDDTVYALLADEYKETDIEISGKIGRKEIRFGCFSNTISAKVRFKNFKYYLYDAVEPLEISPVSGLFYGTDDFVATDAVVNDSGNAWIGTLSGMRFYFDTTKRMTIVENDNLVRSVAFSNNNTLFVAADTGVKYSLDHVNLNSLSIDGLSKPTSMVFDRNNRLIIGSRSGANIVTISRSADSLEVDGVDRISELDGVPINSISIDENNIVWFSTNIGIFRYFKGSVKQFTVKDGLSSNIINDIAIRNTAIRYIATSSGINKMIGTQFEIISSDQGEIAANSVKSIAWQNPNILWAGTLSKLNQLIISGNSIVKSETYGPEYYSLNHAGVDDRQIFHILTEDTIDPNAYVEVYLNGNRLYHGYAVSLDNPDVKFVRFETPLLESDTVDVVIRNDITLLSSFAQTRNEIQEIGRSTVRVKKIDSDGSNIYVSLYGDKNELILNDSGSNLPSDRIHLDATPPRGCLQISDIVDSSSVRLSVIGEGEGEDATDGDNGSGIDKMIVSNFPNFTSDGETPLDTIPFRKSILHSLDRSLAGPVNTISNTLIFSSGDGSVSKHFSVEGETYIATSKPATLYKLDISTGEWNSVVSFGDNDYIDFIERFRDKFIISVGHDSNAARIYSYKDDGKFTSPKIRILDGNRAYSSVILDGLMYIGTGGNGNLYSFNGESLTLVKSGISSHIYDLVAYNSEIFAATGDSGKVWRIMPSADSDVYAIVHSDSDTAILSVGVFESDSKKLLFAGTSSEGKILRSSINDLSFNDSFRTISSSVNSIEVVNGVVYACVGRSVFTFDSSNTWTWRYSHEEDIKDISITENGILFIASASKAVQIGTGSDVNKSTVYLKLIDKAGNETNLFADDGEMQECFFKDITLEDLLSGGAGGSSESAIFNENKILELDEFGNIVDTIKGSSRFYSANKIIVEKGEYVSNIFNGTNDIVKWDKISWSASQPSGTEVLLYVRTSVSETDILTKKWIGPYSVSESGSVDISSLSGQFFQFKIVLMSSEKGLSPSVSNVIIKVVTAESLHFFTTNFVLPSRLKKGILTSNKLIPVAADVVFGINTENSVDWSDYQIIDENRLFDVTQFNKNLRVGIKLLSPSRSAVVAADFDEYGPYNSNMFINTIDFVYENTGSSSSHHFKVTFYDDLGLTQKVYQAYSGVDQDNWNVDGDIVGSDGVTIPSNGQVRVLFTPPGDSGLNCNTFYFVKVEVFDGFNFATQIDDYSFISGCNASFVDTIDFDFTNTYNTVRDYHFRIRFYDDAERTNLILTKFSGNDKIGWTVDGSQIDEEGIEIQSEKTESIVFEPSNGDLNVNTLYYIVIDAYDGSDFILASNSYTFLLSEVSSSISCGPYIDVPVVKNFALMFELFDNEFVTLNLR